MLTKIDRIIIAKCLSCKSVYVYDDVKDNNGKFQLGEFPFVDCPNCESEKVDAEIIEGVPFVYVDILGDETCHSKKDG